MLNVPGGQTRKPKQQQSINLLHCQGFVSKLEISSLFKTGFMTELSSISDTSFHVRRGKQNRWVQSCVSQRRTDFFKYYLLFGSFCSLTLAVSFSLIQSKANNESLNRREIGGLPPTTRQCSKYSIACIQSINKTGRKTNVTKEQSYYKERSYFGYPLDSSFVRLFIRIK